MGRSFHVEETVRYWLGLAPSTVVQRATVNSLRPVGVARRSPGETEPRTAPSARPVTLRSSRSMRPVSNALSCREAFGPGAFERAPGIPCRPPPGTNVTGTVVAHHRWGLELLLDDWAEATVDLRFIDDVAVIGDQSRWPAIGTRLSGRVQGTTPNGQLRVSLRRSDQMWTHARADERGEPGRRH